jgi:antitoxin Phd
MLSGFWHAHSSALFPILDLSARFLYNLDRLDRRYEMTGTWQLQEAKNRLSEVIEEALAQGPQIITRRGVETAVVLSYADFRRMSLQQVKLSEFFRESPLAGMDLDLTRDTSPLRADIAL